MSLVPTVQRFSVPCYSCDGKGMNRTETDEYPIVEECRWCYRGHRTIRLSPDDARKLIEEIKNAFPLDFVR